MKLHSLVSLKYQLLGIVSFIINVSGCDVERKPIDEARTLTCSNTPSETSSYTWLFNNQSQVDESVVISAQGRAIVIPFDSISVYGDYSCFENDSFVNCFSVYIGGTCNQTCSQLTADNTTVIVNSTITFHSIITVRLSPDDHGTMLLRKDGSVIGSNIIHTSLNLPQVTYYIHNAQLSDGGVYDAEYIGTYTMLFTNQLHITVVEINFTTSSSQALIFTIPVPPSTFMNPQETPTGNGTVDSGNSENVGAIVGPIVGALVASIIVIAIIVIVIRCYQQNCKGSGFTVAEEESNPPADLPQEETGFYQREDNLQENSDGEPM